MRRTVSIVTGLLVGVVLTLSMATQTYAKDKSATAKQNRLSGTIHMINKDTKTITLTTGNMQRQVVYDDNTKFTFRNKAGSLDDVKEGRRVICLGHFNDKSQLEATRVDVREGR
jgi:Cu/Ag efflux protein CusF